jgi:hypothetical protein
MNRLALSLSCVALLAACDKKDDTKPAAPAATDKPAAAAPKATGLNDPANDPKIVALAKKALGCKWVSGSFESECADAKAWEAESDAFADNKGDGTLVAFTEDSDEKVRSLVLKRFTDWNKAFADKALAERLVAVAEKTKASNEMYPLGNIISHMKVAETGLFPRIKALVTSTSGDPALRGAIIMYLLQTNPESEEVIGLTRETVKDKESRVNRNALEAFSMSGTDKPNEARCDFFLENIDHPDNDLAGESAEYLTQPRFGCKARFGAVLTSLEARVKAKKVTVATFVNALISMCGDKAGTPAQMKTANGLAHKLAEDKTVASSVRASAIEASVKCDPKGAKAYLGKFKKDADAEVQTTIGRLQKKKK